MQSWDPPDYVEFGCATFAVPAVLSAAAAVDPVGKPATLWLSLEAFRSLVPMISVETVAGVAAAVAVVLLMAAGTV